MFDSGKGVNKDTVAMTEKERRISIMFKEAPSDSEFM